jgi:hypothetical protein
MSKKNSKVEIFTNSNNVIQHYVKINYILKINEKSCNYYKILFEIQYWKFRSDIRLYYQIN